MTFKGTVLAYEDSSYQGKRGNVAQETLTCIDADEIKLKDTVDCVFPTGVVPNASQLVGKTVEFFVDAIRPSNNMRPRLMVKGIKQKAA